MPIQKKIEVHALQKVQVLGGLMLVSTRSLVILFACGGSRVANLSLGIMNDASVFYLAFFSSF